MIPKVDMVTIQVKDDTNEIIKRIIESGHSRYPVLGEERNEVAGILLAKDILPKLFKGTADFDINEMLRDPNVVPETKKADSLLEEFKQDRSHLAVVIDEYGEICGLITIEDILEEIVGEIEDEFYEEKTDEIIKINQDEFIVSATLDIEKFDLEENDNQFKSTDYLLRYKFITPWAALNRKMFSHYKSLSENEKMVLLKKLIGQNLLFLSKELGPENCSKIYTNIDTYGGSL